MTARFKRLPNVGDPPSGTHTTLVSAARAFPGDPATEIRIGPVTSAPWWDAFVQSAAGTADGEWQTRAIPTGLWLFRGHPSVAEAAIVGRIPADPERLGVVVGAPEPDQTTLGMVSRVLSSLPTDGPRAVRLFLPFLDHETGREFARNHRLDLVAAPAELRVQGGLASVCGYASDRPHSFWQWYRTSFGEPVRHCGALHPQPRWEEALNGRNPIVDPPTAVTARIPAGFSARPLGPADTGFLRFAAEVPARADRLRIVVQASGIDPLILASCTGLLQELPTAATRQVELVWPYAGTREASDALGELAARVAGIVVAPAAGLAPHPNGRELLAVHEDGSLGHWVTFTPDGSAHPHGPLSPPPAWGRPLKLLLGNLPPNVETVQAPAGLHLRGAGHHDLTALVGALAPERDGVTVLADGDAHQAADRDRLLAVLERFGPQLLRRLRVVMFFADEGPRSFAQALADRLRIRLMVSTTDSIKAALLGPDGRAQPTQLAWSQVHPRDGEPTGSTPSRS